uniref:Uncharacterized protein n=1 Tax=Arundo donax TaxID=35708 RepID=A0A0A8Z6U5_ARUDO
MAHMAALARHRQLFHRLDS